MKALFSGGLPGMPPMPGIGAARRAASKSARKKGKKKAPRSGDPRRAAELAREAKEGATAHDRLRAMGGVGADPLGGLPDLSGLPDGLDLANLPPGLNLPNQGNIPAAFRGKRPKKK
jgi:signal recognition particle subunit SRP54